METGFFNNHDYYHCKGNDFVYFYEGQFHYATGGDPTITGANPGMAVSSGGVVGNCPALYTTWTGNDNLDVLCGMLGPVEIDDWNECLRSPCSGNATCTGNKVCVGATRKCVGGTCRCVGGTHLANVFLDRIDGHSCECLPGFIGDGETCELIEMANECEMGIHDCQTNAVCIDELIGFRCECDCNSYQTDTSLPSGQACMTKPNHCKKVLIF